MTNAPQIGRIHWCKTQRRRFEVFLLQHTAGPYIRVKTYRQQRAARCILRGPGPDSPLPNVERLRRKTGPESARDVRRDKAALSSG